jgi:hypothetical protein
LVPGYNWTPVNFPWMDASADAKRIRWAADDMIQIRPALSGWHPGSVDRFAAWMKK